MQYLLSEEEYGDLKKAADLGRRFEGQTIVHMTVKQLQSLCTKIADTLPVRWGWGEMPDPKPWGCKITVERAATDEGFNHPEWYCNQCPVTQLCPHPGKEYSK